MRPLQGHVYRQSSEDRAESLSYTMSPLQVGCSKSVSKSDTILQQNIILNTLPCGDLLFFYRTPIKIFSSFVVLNKKVPILFNTTNELNKNGKSCARLPCGGGGSDAGRNAHRIAKGTKKRTAKRNTLALTVLDATSIGGGRQLSSNFAPAYPHEPVKAVTYNEKSCDIYIA